MHIHRDLSELLLVEDDGRALGRDLIGTDDAIRASAEILIR
jgi:hypothetical protein